MTDKKQNSITKKLATASKVKLVLVKLLPNEVRL